MPKKLDKQEFIDKAKFIHNNKFDYSLVEYTNNKNKIKIICPEHGIFEQEGCSHLKGNGCKKCFGRGLTNEEYINKVKKIHNNKYDYSQTDYKGVFKKIKIICPEHGIFEQMSDKHLKGNGCPICRNSKGEKEIMKYFIENGVSFIHQKKFKECKDIKELPFDFYLPDINTCIEYDGRQHFEVIDRWGGLLGLIDQQKKDKIKTEYCETNNIKLFRISYKDNIKNKLNEIINVIYNK